MTGEFDREFWRLWLAYGVVKPLLVLGLLLALALGSRAHAGALDDCRDSLPWGAPAIPGAIQAVCAPHRGYVAFVDLDAKVPRLVAYRLSPPAAACVPRRNNFHAEAALPRERRARPEDYRGSGYDMGHQAPAEDFAGDAGRMSDSFSLANMAPQLPGLNRQGWERIEDDVRGWALARPGIEVYVGPVLGAGARRIGSDRVVVPAGFFKVVVDPRSGAALAFVMPQAAIAKADAPNYETTIAQAEAAAGFALPLPPGIDHAGKLPLWAAGSGHWCN